MSSPFGHGTPSRKSLEMGKSGMPPVSKPKRARQKHFLRNWRKFRGYSLERASEQINMSRENLGRVERGEVPYSQDLLEELAEAYTCEVADLLIRDPLESEAIWSIWANAQPAQRVQIISVARALVGPTEPNGDPSPPSSQSPEQEPHKGATRRRASGA